jgi:predicted nucleic acid-binding protein
MTASILRVVFDCVIYAQAIISHSGPAAACLDHVRAGELRLIWSDYVLQEIRELPQKLPTRLQVTLERVEIFILALASYVRPCNADPRDLSQSVRPG